MTENTERVKAYLAPFGFAERVHEFADGATATVPLAAAAIGCQEAQIAKSMSFKTPEGGIYRKYAAEITDCHTNQYG